MSAGAERERGATAPAGMFIVARAMPISMHSIDVAPGAPTDTPSSPVAVAAEVAAEKVATLPAGSKRKAVATQRKKALAQDAAVAKPAKPAAKKMPAKRAGAKKAAKPAKKGKAKKAASKKSAKKASKPAKKGKAKKVGGKRSR